RVVACAPRGAVAGAAAHTEVARASWLPTTRAANRAITEGWNMTRLLISRAMVTLTSDSLSQREGGCDSGNSPSLAVVQPGRALKSRLPRTGRATRRTRTSARIGE